MKVWLNKDGTATAWDSGTKTYLQYNGGKFFEIFTPEQSEDYMQLKLDRLRGSRRVQDDADDDEVEMNYR
jgi:hypothetical protein